MGKIEELKDYLRCVGNSIYDSDEVEKKFEIIAEILLNWCIIRVNAKRFRILEIEFYLFGGKGNHKDIIAYPSPLRAVPLAVLLAMSPLNTISAQNVIAEGLTENKVSVYDDGTKRKIFKYEVELPEIMAKNNKMTLIFNSTDGDDIPEKVVLNKVSKTNSNYTDENGERIKSIIKETEIMQGKALKIEHITTKDMLGNTQQYDAHYLVGGVIRSVTHFDREDENIKLGKTKTFKSQDAKISISQDLYKKIAATMSKNIDYIEENKNK